MVLDWAGFRAHRMATIEAHGQWVGVLDRDWQPLPRSFVGLPDVHDVSCALESLQT